MTHQALDLGHPGSCVDLSEEALRRAAGKVDRHTQALLLVTCARAYGAADLTAQAASALLRAEQALDGRHPARRLLPQHRPQPGLAGTTAPARPPHPGLPHHLGRLHPDPAPPPVGPTHLVGRVLRRTPRPLPAPASHPMAHGMANDPSGAATPHLTAGRERRDPFAAGQPALRWRRSRARCLPPLGQPYRAPSATCSMYVSSGANPHAARSASTSSGFATGLTGSRSPSLLRLRLSPSPSPPPSPGQRSP